MCKNCTFCIFWQTWKELPFENSKLVPILIVHSLNYFFSYFLGIKNGVFEDPNSLPSTIPDELDQPDEPKFQLTLDEIFDNQPESVQQNINVSNSQQENIQDLLDLSQQEKQNEVHSGSKKWHINSETMWG